uniref:Uncharacterized protein n=1 Tax=Arundo donax TaxID=35708 RepID=A0A0A8ZIZ6_ARUDO
MSQLVMKLCAHYVGRFNSVLSPSMSNGLTMKATMLA